LPLQLRRTLVPRFLDLQDELENLVAKETHTIAFGSDPNRISQVLLNETKSMIKLLQQPEPDNAQQLQQEMIDWMMRWDQEFDLDARNYFPEHRHWLEKMGYHV
jgi:hypothetical protein